MTQIAQLHDAGWLSPSAWKWNSPKFLLRISRLIYQNRPSGWCA